MVFTLQAETVTRETFWLVGSVGKAVFYFLAALAVVVFLYGVYDRFARYARGTDDAFARLDDLPGRVVSAARTVLSNRNQFNRDLYGGLMHTFIMWGFLTLLIGTTILGIDMDGYRLVTGLFGEERSFFVGDFYLSYSLIMDALGFLFVVGLGMAIYRRHVVRTDQLWGRHTSLEDGAFVWTLFLLGVGGYLLEGLRILATGFPSFANVVTRDEKAGVRLPGVPADAAPDEIGFTEVGDMSWRQRLDHDACTKCGRCSSVCPAKVSGRPLDPRNVILDLKNYRESVDAGGESKEIVADGGTSVIDSRTMESCMSCMACMDACPVDIEHVPQFTQMNRRLTETGEMDDNVQETMMDVFGQGNSFGDPERKRPNWVEELDFEVPDARDHEVEYLWYVGDYPSYDERNRRVARSLATIFEHAGVDYGILYEDEQNDGNDVRRVGEEGLYEMLAEDNAAAFEACEFDKLVCTDPHSYNTFKNEYPELDGVEWNSDGAIDVHHYTQVAQELAETGRIDLSGTELEYTVTYYDPCHLGRMNNEFEAPRDLIRRTGCTLDEMPRNRANSFCCGGGGGGLWMDFDEEPKPSEERLREALEDTDAGSGIEKFVVACPMCMTMYEDGRKTGNFEDEIEVVGLSELLAEAFEASTTTAVVSESHD